MFRTKHTYSTPDGGVVNTKKRTYTGPGRAPAGTRKVRPKRASEVPTVTTSPTGQVTTSGFPSPQAASKASTRQQRVSRRVARIAATERRAETRAKRQLLRPEPPAPSRARVAVKAAEPLPTQPVSFREPAPQTTRQLEGTPRQRKGVRVRLRRSKQALRQASGPLPGLGPQETHVARTVLQTGERSGATRKEQIAAAETGLVESDFRNLPGGTADSEGWRQERSSLYPNPRNVKASAARFFSESVSDTGGTRGRGMTAGQLAQTIQGSAYPERYDERKPEAVAIVRSYKRGIRAGNRVRRLTGKARSLGMKTGSPELAAELRVGPPPKKLVKRVVVAEHAMHEIEGQPYVWGGGHGSFVEYGKDCSGAVSYVLHKVAPDRVKAPLTSGDMGSVLEPGPGALTVFYNADHTFLRLINRKGEAEYWGTSVGDSGAGGLTRHPTPSAAYLAQYNVGHVPGMGRKQALQLGAEPAFMQGGQTIAGMTFSPDGTTATIAPGGSGQPGGAHKGKPGFSKLPIRPESGAAKLQRIRGGSVGPETQVEEGEGGGPQPSQLSALERKYGKAAV